MERQELECLIEKHHSVRRIATAAQVSYSTIRYWLKRLNLKSDGGRERATRLSLPSCRNCEKPVRRNPNVYCSLACQNQFRRRRKFERGDSNSSFLKTYLLDIRERKCEVCGITEWMGKPSPLELDHLDGDASNNQLNNLRLICPNCHAQTETYKNRNKGRGRFSRRERYAKGKSY